MSSDSNTQRRSVDETFGTILPSYSMFTSTLGRNVNVPELDDNPRNLEPPVYNREDSFHSDAASSTSSSHLSSGFNNLSLGSSRTSVTSTTLENIDEQGSFIIADENTGYWKETILDNVHHLPNLTFQSHKISEAVKLEIYYTKDICEIGKKPELIGPSIFEYKQGDLLTGYILIRNESDKPIPYEMFYLLFEGNYMIANKSNAADIVPVKVRKFLEMFDFSGSWNDGNISRLVTEVRNPYICEDIRDPIDGTALCFGEKRIIYPGITYKRFFTFRIPDSLLDSECNEHGLSKHVELPPTMGLSRWEVAHYPERAKTKLKDFCPIVDSVSYGVMARFIGRKSTWEADFGKIITPSRDTRLINAKGDEYIILKELTNHFRVVQKTTIPTDSERLMKLLENKLMYNNLISRIKEKIDMGKQMIESIENNEFTSTIDIGKQLTQTEIEMAKCKQLYRPDCVRDAKADPNKIEYYETFLPLVKKSITGSKELGTLKMASPKKEYCVCYIPPTRFRSYSIDKLTPSWNFEISLDLSIQFPSLLNKAPQIPTIKAITAELVVLTVSSAKLPIPIEFNHDLVFNKQNTGSFIDSDNFETNIVKPFKKYSNELYQIYKTLGSSNFKIEKQLIEDLKALCELDHKCFNLVVQDVKVNGQSYKKDSLNWTVNKTSASASIKVGVNLESLLIKGNTPNKSHKAYDMFTLVPDFQSCFMSRMYHIRLTVQLSNGSYSNIKIPVRIQKLVG
ncbi:hypothetical protein G210_5465 [Candida maltosa Xu316]|uniref:Bul1 N-terminal domain-containing protein n=1 Tax=Candida maltosa (strain Xu316) TaxID=1245528 RepID=M3IT09_CANMX|nr:hypothetical protein G210_5465 [Candida maltosa Xu316]